MCSYRYPTQPRRGWPHHQGLRTASPTLFKQWCGFFYVPHEPDKRKCCEMGPTIFRAYPRRLESLSVYSCHYKGSFFFSVIFQTPECWSGQVLNPRPPSSVVLCSPNWANLRLLVLVLVLVLDCSFLERVL